MEDIKAFMKTKENEENIYKMMNVSKAVAKMCSVKKVFLEISANSQENTFARVPFLIKLQALACNFIKRETLAQVLSCEFCKIFKNTLK